MSTPRPSSEELELVRSYYLAAKALSRVIAETEDFPSSVLVNLIAVQGLAWNCLIGNDPEFRSLSQPPAGDKSDTIKVRLTPGECLFRIQNHHAGSVEDAIRWIESKGIPIPQEIA